MGVGQTKNSLRQALISLNMQNAIVQSSRVCTSGQFRQFGVLLFSFALRADSPQPLIFQSSDQDMALAINNPVIFDVFDEP